MPDLKAVIDLAEAGDGDVGLSLWKHFASYREEGLDLSEMPAELVAWFDRRLEALTDIPVATGMGELVNADGMARLMTPHLRDAEEELAALCLWPPKKKRRRKFGRPSSSRKTIADGILAAQAAKVEASRKRMLAEIGEAGRTVPAASIYREVAANHGFSAKRVERAVHQTKSRDRMVRRQAGASTPVPGVKQRLLSESQSEAFLRALQARGFQRLQKRGQLPPRTYRAVRDGDQVRVEYREP